MQIPGHLAVAFAQYRGMPARPPLKWLLLASLFPDVVDKSIGYLLHLMPNGRHFAHNLFSLTATSALVGLVWGRTAGRAWFWGYLGHLLADGNDRVPWLFPFRQYRFSRGRLRFKPAAMLVESIFLAAVILYPGGREFPRYKS
ncbi:MAG: metal-dependent hydrolase [Chloroflexi bacterium]|nr:MAG: metal-dependent hydrolase [Chloroflexota bacterium]